VSLRGVCRNHNANKAEIAVAHWYSSLTPKLREFIGEQLVFFVGTAPDQGRINLSPKGMDTFRVIDDNHVAYLDLTGSGSETAAHLRQNGRITIMFCSFTAQPGIARLYGRGRIIRQTDPEWTEYRGGFPSLAGDRQIMFITIESAMTSCGYGVPRMENPRERGTLARYWEERGDQAKENYWAAENYLSIDGIPTGVLDDRPDLLAAAEAASASKVPAKG
jgi:hypothetical protein